MTRKPYLWTKTPARCQRSCQRNIVFPSPTSNLINFLASSINLKSALQPQVHSCGIFTVQKHLPLRRFAWIQATQRDPALVNKLQIYFIIATLCNPNPPSLLGKQTFSHAIVYPMLVPCPCHHKWLKFYSRVLMTFLGRIKLLDQNHYILYRTDRRSCNLPAKDSFLDDHDLILLWILSISG